jgi:hypothetical protein
MYNCTESTFIQCVHELYGYVEQWQYWHKICLSRVLIVGSLCQTSTCCDYRKLYCQTKVNLKNIQVVFKKYVPLESHSFKSNIWICFLFELFAGVISEGRRLFQSPDDFDLTRMYLIIGTLLNSQITSVQGLARGPRRHREIQILPLWSSPQTRGKTLELLERRADPQTMHR